MFNILYSYFIHNYKFVNITDGGKDGDNQVTWTGTNE